MTGEEESKIIIWESRMECPVCGAQGTFIIRRTNYNLPGEGETILFSGKCLRCGFRITWILPAEEGVALRHELEVAAPSDVNTLVYVGENTDILIPELGLEFSSSELEPGFITTVEGILERFKEKVDFLCGEEGCEDLKRMIEEAAEGKRRFTLILIDRYGRSRILSDKAKVERLEENSSPESSQSNR